ncbi:MAG: nicotinate phosphoribosyltransferase, partial [Desulfomonile tiedjei]|nr:nicotinate phosphoribosyltransferase [Desulfomonile tiedjei]
MRPIFRDPETGRLFENVEIVDAESGNSLGKLDTVHAIDGQRCKNYTLDTDLYELTMVAGYKLLGK